MADDVPLENAWNLRYRSREEFDMLQEFRRVNFAGGAPAPPPPPPPPPLADPATRLATGGSRDIHFWAPRAPSTSHNHAGPSTDKHVPTRPRGRPSKRAQEATAFKLPSQPAPRDHGVYVDRSGDMEITVYSPRKRPRLSPSPSPPSPPHFSLDDASTIFDDRAPEPDAMIDLLDSMSDDGMADTHPDGVDIARDGPATSFLDAEGEINDVVEADSLKRKRHTSSDDPMKEWMPWESQMQEEALRRHGLGDSTYKPECCSCGVAASDDVSLYRCRTCGSDFLQCERCCLEHHRRTPLHVLDTWVDGSWDSTSLTELGLVYQVGHQGGPCPAPERAEQFLTVMHYPAVHTIRMQYCACSRNANVFHWQQLFRNGWYPATTHRPGTCASIDTLNFYRRLKTIANVSVRDFVTSLESTTNPYGTDWVPDRYKAFGRMSRQWSYLQRVRRSGVAHEAGGVKAAKWGSVAVKCWACPRAGVNIPENLDDIPENEQYKYQRIISVDANFKLKCKMRPSPRKDPPLYSGLGTQVPENEYHEWLRSYVTEEEISSCIAFAALMNKETKFSTGLRWTGVLGVSCARHELMLGLGDLAKGERYKNTDFVVLWVLALILGIKRAAITYDIACQYKINFFKRLPTLPKILTELGLPELSFALPVWHGNVHEVACETANSARYQVGLGKTDGEGPERLWSLLNPISYMTREEQPGARHDDHEDKINSINFNKNIDIGQTLLRRLRIAYEERATQVSAFVELDSALDPSLRAGWMAMVNAWLADRTKPNPYAPSGQVTVSETKVRADLRAQELADELNLERDAEEPDAEDLDQETDPSGGCEREGCSHEHCGDGAGAVENASAKVSTKKGKARSGRTRRLRNPVKDRVAAKKMTPTSFIVLGLQLEDTIARLNTDRKASVNLTLAKETKIHERSTALAVKLKSFRRHQDVMMPGAASLVLADIESRVGPRLPEDSILFLPSECLVEGERVRGMCAEKLYDIEASLRKGRCSDSLLRLRSRLMTRRHFVNYRNAHVTGQNETSRAARLIQSLSARVDQAAAQYRHGYMRLLALLDEEDMEGLRALDDKDVELVNMAENDADASQKLGRAGKSGRESRVAPNTKKPKEGAVSGESRRVVSWIWGYAGGPQASTEEYLHECVRIEWTKALARKLRWSEEVEILRAEIKRVLLSLRYEEDEWTRREQLPTVHLRLPEAGGRAAYARRQAKDRARIADRFRENWLIAEPPRGRKAGPMDNAVLEDIIHLLDSFSV